MGRTKELQRRLRRHPAGAALASGALEVLAARRVTSVPTEALVPLEAADDVVLVLSRRGRPDFHPEAYSLEQAFAAELALRGRPFAMTDDPAAVTGKRVLWAHPTGLVQPALWDYARQVREFAGGLASQGNTLYPSPGEVAFWENKAFMHRRLDDVGAPTPPTQVVGPDDVAGLDPGAGPLLVKQEHSAGSDGIDFFDGPDAVRAFLRAYRFRPGESVIVQSIVPGATRDLRLTMVGDRAMASSTYWRVKSAEALARTEWVTTATTFGSTVVHEPPPPRAVEACAQIMADLGVRTAGFDLMWVDDDTSGTPLVLELSPFYQPNPPKPPRFADEPYKSFKARRFRADGYFEHQHRAHRDIAAATLDQALF